MEFEESGFRFEFDDSWEVCQLDSEADYRNKLCKQVPETKCIDFIGFNVADETLLFMEVKNFIGHFNPVNKQRLLGGHDDLSVEVAQKIRDSLAVLIGGSRNSTHHKEKWQRYVSHLNQNKLLKVVAWVELDVSTEVYLKRAKINLQTRRDQLRKKMTWLTSDVQVLNSQNYDYTLNGIAVHRMEK